MAVRFSPGGVLRIPLSEGRAAYGLMLAVRPFMAFHVTEDGTGASSAEAAQEALARAPLFTLSVTKTAYSQGRWGAVLHRVRKEELPAVPEFFRQNALNLADCSLVAEDGSVKPVAPERCVGMERDAVWSAEHIESRLEDHFAGRSNAFVESIAVKLPG